MNCNKIQTPYFVVNKNKLDDLTNDAINALKKYWSNGIIGYSFKTNNLPWLIKYMKSNGLYAEVVSSDEFNLARELGFTYDKIIFNGPVKGKQEFLEAINQNCIVNLDSNRELHWLKESKDIKAKIGLRVNFDLEKLCPGESQCGNEDGRFGFSFEKKEFEKALIYLKENDIHLSGIHLHCSSKTRSLNIYKAIAHIACELVHKYNLNLDYVDIGGGFFGGVKGKPTFDEYFKNVSDIFKQEELLKDVNLIIEPGMSLVGAPIDYVTTVVDVKNTVHNCFVLTDGSRIHIDPLMRKSGYTYELSKNSDDSVKIQKQTLCGFTCMENDRFFTLENSEKLNINDTIIFKKVGAYTMGLSPLFIQFFPPVYLNDNNQLLLIREKWDAKKII